MDCLFEIYKLLKLIFRFLKTFSKTEVINKGVLLKRMLGTYNTALANVSFFLYWTTKYFNILIGGEKTLSKFLIKIITLLLELSIWATAIEQRAK